MCRCNCTSTFAFEISLFRQPSELPSLRKQSLPCMPCSTLTAQTEASFKNRSYLSGMGLYKQSYLHLTRASTFKSVHAVSNQFEDISAQVSKVAGLAPLGTKPCMKEDCVFPQKGIQHSKQRKQHAHATNRDCDSSVQASSKHAASVFVLPRQRAKAAKLMEIACPSPVGSSVSVLFPRA